MITIRNNSTGEVCVVSSTDGYDMKVWQVVNAPPPADYGSKPYRLDANGNWIPGALQPVPPVTAFDFAKAAGFAGDVFAWVSSLKGNKGDKGDVGPPGTTGVTRVEKTEDTARSTAALADDPHLSVTLLPNTSYRIELRLWVVTTGLTAGLQWTMTGPAGATMVIMEPAQGSGVVATALASVRRLVSGPGTYLIAATGIVTTGSGTGNLTLQWAQSTLAAGSATTLKAHSRLEAVRPI